MLYEANVVNVENLWLTFGYRDARAEDYNGKVRLFDGMKGPENWELIRHLDLALPNVLSDFRFAGYRFCLESISAESKAGTTLTANYRWAQCLQKAVSSLLRLDSVLVYDEENASYGKSWTWCFAAPLPGNSRVVSDIPKLSNGEEVSKDDRKEDVDGGCHVLAKLRYEGISDAFGVATLYLVQLLRPKQAGLVAPKAFETTANQI